MMIPWFAVRDFDRIAARCVHSGKPFSMADGVRVGRLAGRGKGPMGSGKKNWLDNRL
jgi:hypothetical protein